eukprot:994676-Prorocentrum_lima.AAC.1
MRRPRPKTRQVHVREVQEHFEREQEVDPSWMTLPTPISTEGFVKALLWQEPGGSSAGPWRLHG